MLKERKKRAAEIKFDLPESAVSIPRLLRKLCVWE
jgi:hypothetical protein